MRTRPLLTVFLGLAVAACASPRDPTQEPSDPTGLFKEIRKRLESSRMLWVAWGAYQAAEMQVKGVIPDLRKRLREIENPPPRVRKPGDRQRKVAFGHRPDPARVPVEIQMARLAILDALVRTGAKLTRFELEPMLDYDTLEPIILLAGNDIDKCEAVLIAVLTGNRWLNQPFARRAAGAMLAQHRSPRLMAALLQHARAESSIDLVPSTGKPDFTEPPPVRRVRRKRRRGGVRPAATPPKGFPPIGYYTFGDTPRGTRVTDGERAVFVHRQLVRPRDQVRFSHHWGAGVSLTKDYDLWTARLLKVAPAALPFRFLTSSKIRYRDALNYEKVIQRFQLVQQGAFDALLNRMKIEKLFPVNDGAKVLDLQITVRDGRLDRRRVLPEIDGVIVR